MNAHISKPMDLNAIKKNSEDGESMKTIFLMRHGETLFNVMDVNQGQCDSPLTENGINQALAAKEWFKN